MAAWDIYGKMKRLPLHKLWGLDIANAPITDYTIGIDSTEIMLKKMAGSLLTRMLLMRII